MNNKGYTLIELIAAIILLTLVAGIATNRIMSAIEKSKEKSEKIFVDKLETMIKEYISIEGSKIKIKNPNQEPITFEKCRITPNENGICEEGLKDESQITELETIKVGIIIDTNDYKTINKSDLINPRNKKKCELDDKDIRIFKDTEYVYYYYIDLNDITCEILEENRIITNIPKNACNAIKANAYNTEKGMCKLS